MLIDFHTHLFPPHIRHHRQRYCDRDPWFHQLYSHPRAHMASAEDLIAEMDESGVAISVAFSFGWTDPALIVEANTYIIEVVRRHHLLVLSHCSEPVGHLYPGKGNVSLSDIVAFLTAFPDIRFIAAHWGGGLPFYTLMPEIQRITANVWYDTAATVYLYHHNIFPTVASLVGANRILFASDYGLLRQKRIIHHIQQSGLDAQSVEMILGKNAQHLLGLDHQP